MRLLLTILLCEAGIFMIFICMLADHEEERRGNDFSGNDLEILKGRVWPAIQSCVSNRYKILLSFFAFYSFIMKSTIISISDRHDIQRYTSILFVIITFLNSYNYTQNSREQWRIVQPHEQYGWREWVKTNDVEIVFFMIMMDLVGGAYFLINLDC